VSALARAARARGRAARREDVAKGSPPSLARELRVLAGALTHGPRFRCANGPIFTAHSVGRIEEALRPAPAPGADDFLSGLSGTVGGRRAAVRMAGDAVLDVAWRRGPARSPRRRVLVIAVARPGSRWPAIEAELRRSAHDVEVRTCGVDGRGKFENVNRLLAAEGLVGAAGAASPVASAGAAAEDAAAEGVASPAASAGAAAEDAASTGAPRAAPAFDWLLVVDDDVVLPRGFLDRFIAIAERLELRIAQPAHRFASHAAWPVTRRRPASVARETAFVEIGPVTAFHRATFGALLPFPDGVRMGWGLDAHWSAVARERGWRIGVVDATPILHAVPAANAYGHGDAIAEARAFLAGRPYVRRDEARTLRTHR
jgi:hypothetical protein